MLKAWSPAQGATGRQGGLVVRPVVTGACFLRKYWDPSPLLFLFLILDYDVNSFAQPHSSHHDVWQWSQQTTD